MALLQLTWIALTISGTLGVHVGTPYSLPDSEKDYMTLLQELFDIHFKRETYYAEVGSATWNPHGDSSYGLGTQYAILAFDNAGELGNAFLPCVGFIDPIAFKDTGSDLFITNVVARSYDFRNGHKRQAEIRLIEDYFSGMLERYTAVNNGVAPHSVSLFINTFSCEGLCASVLSALALEYPDINFFIGYKHMHAQNLLETLDALSGIRNLYFSDISGSVVEYDWTKPTGWKDKCHVYPKTATHTMYGVSDTLRGADPPQYAGDDWYSRSVTVTGYEWDKFKFLFLNPIYGELFGVLNENLYSGFMSYKWQRPWKELDDYDSSSNWDQYTFLFFDHLARMYGADSSGLYYNTVPEDGDEDWKALAVQVGSAGWTSFQFLFAHPSDLQMYAVKDGKFYRGGIPTESGQLSAQEWMNEATLIGTNGWDSFKLLFFHSNGLLYAAGYDGTLRAASPPQYATDNWYGRATLLGTAGWNNFSHLFIDLFAF